MKLFGCKKSSTTSLENRKNPVFLVTVPDHVGPGGEFYVNTGLDFVEVRCPPDTRPGQPIRVLVVPPRDATPGSNGIDCGRRLPHDSPNVINTPAKKLRHSCSWLKMRHPYKREIDSSLLHCAIFTYALQEVGPNPLGTPLQQLEAYLDQCSNRSSHQSIIAAKLELTRVVITRRMINLLLPLLSCEDDEKDHASRGRTSNKGIPPVRFSSVSIQRSSRFFSPSDVVTSEQAMDVCTNEDKASFFAALACGLKGNLSLVLGCPEMVSNFLLHVEIDRLPVKRLEICQRLELQYVEYVRPGTIIPRTVQRMDLSLSLPFVNAPRDFCGSLVNATHIQKLNLCVLHDEMLEQKRDEILSNLIVGDCGNGVVGRLLQNPQSQLTHLELHKMDLDDYNFIALVQLMPASQVKKIDLSHSNIQPSGLLELFRQLPNIRTLNSIAFRERNLVRYALEERVECGEALLHGFIENPSIIQVSSLDIFPQRLLLWHYCTLNRAGRRIHTSDGLPVLDGLWPTILAQAGNLPTIRVWDENYHAAANAVYFFLQNYPTLCSYCVMNPDKCKDTVGSPEDASNAVCLYRKPARKKIRNSFFFRHG